MLFETPRFYVQVGTINDETDPQYLVVNKETSVVEFCNSSLYFVRDWSLQMTKALEVQDWEIANPGKDYPEDNVVQFPSGGKNGRAN